MKQKPSPTPPFSETISEFCKMMEDARLDYSWNRDEVARMDGLTQDYLHQLELDGLDYKARARVATQLSLTRQRRRACKDTVAALEPLVIFLESEKGKTLLGLMKEVLGKTRRVEDRLQNRVYIPRVLWQEESA